MSKNTELLTDETLSKKLIQRGFWLYFFWYLTAPLWYLVRLFVSNSPEVSVADFWVMYSIISLVAFLYTYNDLWLTESLKFFLPRFYLKKEYSNIKSTVWLSLWAQISTGFLIAACLWFWSDWLAVHYFQSDHSAVILKYFCIYFFLTNIFQILQTIFSSFQRTFETQFISFIQWICILVFTIFCFYTGRWNIERYSLIWIIWTTVWILVGLFFYRKYRWDLMHWKFNVDRVVLKKYVKYALWSFMWAGIWSLFGQIIQQLVLYIIWAENAWYYSNFLSLFNIWAMLIGPIMWLIFPVVSELIEKKDHYKLWLLYSFFYNYFYILILSFSTLLVVLWPEISVALFWKEYLTSWILLELTWVFLVFSQLSWFNYGVLAWMWRVRERVYITWISCVLTIIFSIILIKSYWIYWAWYAFWLSTFFPWVLSLYLLKKEKFRLNFDYKFVIKNSLLFIVLWLLIYFTKNYLIDIDWNRWYMVVKIVLTWIAFYLIVWLCNINIFLRLKSEINNLRK